LTAVPGASDVFVGSVIAYADEIKQRELDVPSTLLERHGAVSAEVASAMAEGVRARLGADIGLAVTGVAGPTGGTDDKPVGLVFVHAAGPDGGRGQRTEFPGDREMIRGRASASALHVVRQLLEFRDTSV
jgi:nicotinamide-nucleotide amidase